MDKNKLLRKWLNNDLNSEELEVFKTLEDYEDNVEILEAAKQFKASNVSDISDFESFKAYYDTERSSVKRLTWMHPSFVWMKI